MAFGGNPFNLQNANNASAINVTKAESKLQNTTKSCEISRDGKHQWHASH